MKVIVTGGSGFVGKRLKKVKPDWIYLSSSDVNMLNHYECLDYFSREKPDAVIHLAGRVGGIKDNATHPADFFYENSTINSNVVHACYMAGVKRLLASLSTCAFPDRLGTLSYPFTEEDFLNGPPAETNRAYGFTKRALYMQIQSYRKQYGVDYSCFCPSNLYGPDDNFNIETSHFVPAMIKKIHEAKENEVVEFWGTGEPLRQQLFVDDLCKAIPELLEHHHGDIPIIVAPDENLSISKMISIFCSMINKKIEVIFNGELDGQFRKDGSNGKFKELVQGFKFTPFGEGVIKTYEWYKKSISNRHQRTGRLLFSGTPFR